MGESAGAGSPVWFMCYGERKRYWRDRGPRHEVMLTGQTRPYKAKRHSALGVRSDKVTRQYHCRTCGHVGWSNHIDLKRMEEGNGSQRTD